MKAMVVGLGRVGFLYSGEDARGFGSSHVGAYLSHPKIDTVIGVDTDNAKLEDVARWDRDVRPQYLEGGIQKKTFLLSSDYVEAIREHQPEIVSVCVPTPAHLEVMRDIIHPKGPLVICLEKPVGVSLDEANRVANRWANIYGLTDQKKPKVCVHFDRRWHPTWRKVKELLDEGRIGKPLLAIGHHPGPLLRSGVHMLDLFNWYFGQPESARALSEKISWMTKKHPETDDAAYNAEIRYNINGPLWQTSAFLLGADLGDVNYQLFDLQIFCEHGSIGVGDNGRTLAVGKVAPSIDYGGLNGLTLDSKHSTQLEQPSNAMESMVNDLVAAVEDSKHQLQSSVEDGVNAQLLVSMIRQSKGKWIKPDDVDASEAVKSI